MIFSYTSDYPIYLCNFNKLRVFKENGLGIKLSRFESLYVEILSEIRHIKKDFIGALANVVNFVRYK